MEALPPREPARDSLFSDANRRFALQQMRQHLEPAPQALAVESLMLPGYGQSQRLTLIGDRRIDDDPGPADGQHVRGADGRAENTCTPQCAFRHDGFQPLREFVAAVVVTSTDVAEIDGQREEDPAFVVDAAEAGMGNDIEALLTAIVRMRAPADVRQQAGSVAQAPLLIGLLGARWREQLVGPRIELGCMLGRAGVQPGMALGEGDADPCGARSPTKG